MNGILLINKPAGITSRDVVNQVSYKLNTKKVGHTGTLDPMARGVLVVCVGKATKIVNLLTQLEKEYIAEVTLGIETDTLDITGKIINDIEVSVTKDQIIRTLNGFIGTYDQEVPIYSAVKINGKKLYEYAREGRGITLPKREVNIKKMELLDDLFIRDNHIGFRFKCLVSKGTYIRSLIKDICTKLDTIGVMSDLVRISQGSFKIDDCILLDNVSSKFLISIRDILDIKKIKVDEYLTKKILNGQILENRYDSSKIMFMYDDKVLAIYQVYDKDSSKIKPYIMFGGIK